MAQGLFSIMTNGAYGGLSDDRFLGADNSYAELENLEIRSNPKYIKLQNSLIKDT